MLVRPLVLSTLFAVAAFAQPGGPDAALNMQAIAQALGVSCQYCHSAARGSGAPEPRKDIARQMVAMTRDLNARVQQATGKAAADATEVKCVTCHRGVPIPKQLNEIITRTLLKEGSDAATAQYRDLRSHYYGHQ